MTNIEQIQAELERRETVGTRFVVRFPALEETAGEAER